MSDSQKEQRAARRIGDTLDSFDPQERTRILRLVLRDNQSILVDPLPSGNLLEILFILMRESIKQTYEDKEYWISKLMLMNKIAQALADYLQELAAASQALDGEDENSESDKSNDDE